MSKRLAWCKLYESWYTTRSHVELGGVALNIGPRLMSLANSSRTVTPDVRGDVRGPSGAPLSLAAIAREVRFSEAETAEALRQLVACGTLIQKDDGCWSFPNFEAWQETRDAARMRAHRERTNSVTVTRTVTGVVTPVSVLSSDLSSSSSEEGVQREEPEDSAATRWLTQVVEAWNRGNAQATTRPNAALPSRRTEKRDSKLLALRSRFPDPDDWEACSAALARDRWHGHQWAKSTLDWAVTADRGGKIEQWMELGRQMRAGAWEPSEPRQERDETAAQMMLRISRETAAREARESNTEPVRVLRLSPSAERYTARAPPADVTTGDLFGDHTELQA